MCYCVLHTLHSFYPARWEKGSEREVEESGALRLCSQGDYCDFSTYSVRHFFRSNLSSDICIENLEFTLKKYNDTLTEIPVTSNSCFCFTCSKIPKKWWLIKIQMS